MSEREKVPDEADAPDKTLGPLTLPSQIVADIVEQAPLYGLSGAIFAVGLVTGRRALARSGAKMLAGQLFAAVTRAAVDRFLPGQDKPAGEEPAASPASGEPPAERAAAGSGKTTSATIATGALVGVAAAAGGGWLLSRLLARKPSADETD